jgi:hypothetical protein
MAQIPVLTKLQLEDVPSEQREWMGKLIPPLNDFISATVAAFSKDLTLSENIRSQTKEMLVTPVASTFTSTGTTTNGSTYVSAVTTSRVLPGQAVSGTGIPANCYVLHVTRTEIVISQAATATASGVTLTFTGHNACPLKFACGIKTVPVHVRVSTVDDISASPAPIATPIQVLDWELTQSREIQINSLSGLLPGQKYRITFLIF